MVSTCKIAVISDEISQDFGRACEVISLDFGMGWVELRELWGKNILTLDSGEVGEVLRILEKNNLGVISIASPLFKTDWPGAPRSKFSTTGDQFKASFTFDEQGDVLDRSLDLAKTFHTDRVRCFDFWRLDDPVPYRSAMNDVLRNAADKAAAQNVILMIENEAACNTAIGAEAAELLAAIETRNFMLVWDPANAALQGETSYPAGYSLLPKSRIGHCHCKDLIKKKDMIKNPGGNNYEWAAVGRGMIDWLDQFKALKRDGYEYGFSLETHWRGAGTPEASTRESWTGMKALMQQAGFL